MSFGNALSFPCKWMFKTFSSLGLSSLCFLFPSAAFYFHTFILLLTTLVFTMLAFNSSWQCHIITYVAHWTFKCNMSRIVTRSLWCSLNFLLLSSVSVEASSLRYPGHGISGPRMTHSSRILYLQFCHQAMNFGLLLPCLPPPNSLHHYRPCSALYFSG